MSHYSFAVSLNPDVQITSAEDHYTLHSAESEPTTWLNLVKTSGIALAFDHLKEGNSTTASLLQRVRELDGSETGKQFALTLEQLRQKGWLDYAVLPLAVATPMVDSAELNLSEPYWGETQITLSRFAYQHSYQGTMVLESPLSKFRVKLLDWRASAILAQLAQPQTLGTITPPPYLGAETAYQFLNLLWAAGFLTAEPEPPSLQLWDFHNLLFHSRSRDGRHDYPKTDIQRSIEQNQWTDFPVVKPPMSDRIVPLSRPNMGALICNDATLTEAIEARESVREYDETHPMTIEQLSELLYRTARLKKIYRMEDKYGEDWKTDLGFDSDFEFGEISSRAYPNGGGMYELEIYPVVHHCEGLSAGLYHYDPLNHQLEQIVASEEDIASFIVDAYSNINITEKGMPQVLLVVTARFGRLFRKYRSIGYALVLKHIGVLYQNFYLVATNMGLAPCALGIGDSDAFASLAGLDYLEESAVGEFALGALSQSDVKASGLESVELDSSEEPAEATVSVSEAESESAEAEILAGGIKPVGLIGEIPKATVEQVAETDAEAVDTNSSSLPNETLDSSSKIKESVESSALSQSTSEPAASEAGNDEVELDVVESEIESQAVSASEVESSSTPIPLALHPHDLDDRIPGLADLRNQTLGDPQITIVILDGNPDHTLSCFEGAEVSKVFPYWHEIPEPISPEDYATFREIDNGNLKGEAKKAALEAAFPELILDRIYGDCHACHITSVIVGQENTPVPGLAPKCRVINVPLNSVGKLEKEGISPLNLARAFELAIDLGANIIHGAMCRPTQTGEGEELFTQAVRKCQDNNILIVSPAGNNKGECWCLPAVLPGTLAVGAANLDGTPMHFSNWGGNYAEEGILAPGKDILGAQPGTEKAVRLMGTSTAAPIMTSISALLMSLQLQEGKPVDAEAVRTALLNTAIPCDPEVVEEPERCLRGSVNIPGAMNLLFGQPSVTISFAGDRVTRTERAGHAMPTPTAAPASIEAAMTETAANPVVEAASLTTPTEVSVTAATTPAESAEPAEPANPSTVEASTAHSGHVYALGTLGYDFGDEARRDTFKQLMAPAELEGIMVPPDPYDGTQVVEHLDRNPDEARSLIWTLNLDQNTLYALEPKGPFASDVYEMFLLMLAGQLEPETSDEFVERISVAARRTNRTVELFSGEIVPVVTVHNVRGMYGWTVNALINAAIASIPNLEPDQEPIMREGINAFLNRVYYDLHNLGQTSRDRALNFAATNIFQAASVFAEAIASERRLDTISVEKSPYCRLHSDCWDVILTFFDPENGWRSRQVYRFTLDVAANLPVTIGTIKRWSIPGKSSVYTS